jgi:signal transduction histidine kinase
MIIARRHWGQVDGATVTLKSTALRRRQQAPVPAPGVTPEDHAGGPISALAATLFPRRHRRRAEDRRTHLLELAHERRRMAADLHDLIMQDLSLALANARALAADPACSPQVSTVVSASERALAGARVLIDGLAERDHRPIAEVVEASVRGAARRIPLTFRAELAPTSPDPDEATRDTLVHIAREAVTNAVKHARASAIEVTLEREDEWLLRVRDDGRGIEASGEGEGEGFGLGSMRRHAEALGGALRIRSGEHGGTIVEASLP